MLGLRGLGFRGLGFTGLKSWVPYVPKLPLPRGSLHSSGWFGLLKANFRWNAWGGGGCIGDGSMTSAIQP